MFGPMLALALSGEPLDVTWTAPPECPQRDAVRAAIADNLAREELGPAADDVHIEGTVAQHPLGWVLTVTVRLPEGAVDRELTAAQCAELANAAGLIIAVALDPLRVDRVRAEPTPPPTGLPQAWANPPRPPAPPPQPDPEPEPPLPKPARRLAFDLRALGMLDVGSLPVVRGGAAVGFGIVGEWFRADTHLLYWAPRALEPFDLQPEAGARLQEAGLGARGCLKPELGAWEPSTCAGLEGGLAWSRGFGIDTPQTTTLPWLTATTGLEIAWVSRARVGAFAGVDAQFHAVRPRVRLDGLGEAVEIAPIGARVVAGLLFRVPR